MPTNTLPHLIIAMLLSLLPAAGATAQDASSPRQLVATAEQQYQIGRIDKALQLLTADTEQFKGSLRERAYRLIALCYLGQDDMESTEAYARMLLSANPFYYSTQDPARFSDIIDRLKTGQSITVTTASSQVETINEAPVPVTFITREMIDQLGFHCDLGTILAYYVPGISLVSTYASPNVAMHGVYNVGQEKILIMENGHRLNARSTNNGRLSYAFSYEKIDHIEVLRGPASSLYGNVALTAVVNIITRKGSAVDGVKARYGYGSYNTHRGDIVAGTTLLGADVLAWGAFYSSKGKDILTPAHTDYTNTNHDSYAHIGKYEGRPSYDLGFNMHLHDFSLALDRRSSKQVPPYSWYGETYDYDQYRKLNGHTPGYTIDETHLELGYSKETTRLNFSVTAYGDWIRFDDYAVVSDSMVQYSVRPDGTADTDNPILWLGTSQDTYWDEYTLGLMARADANYRLAGMHGNVLFGAQYEHFTLHDTYSLIGKDYNTVSSYLAEPNNYIRTGSEESTSYFVQAKHYLSSKFILNAGLRYDNKYRVNRTHIDAFSPRLAIVYTHSAPLSIKLSYARSFVDAPYFYRQNTAPAYAGSQDLMPEYMKALQLNFLGTLREWHLTYDINIFYNHLTDIISNTQNTGANTAKYHNSGRLKTWGTEAELLYQPPKAYARLTMSYLKMLSAEDYSTADGSIYSIPAFTANLNVARQLLGRDSHKVWASANIRLTTQTLERVHQRRRANYPDFHGPTRVIADANLRYNYAKWLELGLSASNLLNTSYEIGGTTYFPYPTLGRTLMATVAFTL